MSNAIFFLVATLLVAFAASAPNNTDFPALNASEGASSAPRYLGCFVDDSTRILRVATKNSHMMSIPMCTLEFCSGFKYGGLEVGVECHCGDEMFTSDSRKKVDDSQCHFQCADSAHFPGTKCGADWRINIYQLK